ncbi:hypothetical protein CF106_12855 [Aeromonas veronii]|nr:hypothetical protein CF106_12855 [Aeromonas veronii]
MLSAFTNRFPLPGERARVRGREYKTLAILYRENRWQSAQIADKREGGISLPLLFSTVISGV